MPPAQSMRVWSMARSVYLKLFAISFSSSCSCCHQTNPLHRQFSRLNNYLLESCSYKVFNQLPSLRDRVPSFKMCHPLPASLVHQYRCPEVICVEMVDGLTLSKDSLAFLPYTPLAALERHLHTTLDIFHHQAGICHGDVGVDNIMVLPRDPRVENGASVRAVFINFSQSVFRECVRPDMWESLKKDDHERLRRIFEAPRAMLVCVIRSF